MLSAIAKRMGRRTAYGWCGIVLSTGAPLGLLLLRSIGFGVCPDIQWTLGELRADPLLYLYLSLSTAIVMGTVGWHVGRYEDELAALSNLDSLTRLPNRRGFQSALIRELSRAARHKSGLSLLMIDVDEFKLVNDRFGHSAGDLALVTIGNSLRESCRQTDVPVRHGGDEFAVLLPSTNADAAMVLARRIAETVRSAKRVTPLAPPLTLSIGVVQLNEDDDSQGASLLARGDAAMYEAKAAGRNRAVLL